MIYFVDFVVAAILLAAAHVAVGVKHCLQTAALHVCWIVEVLLSWKSKHLRKYNNALLRVAVL